MHPPPSATTHVPTQATDIHFPLSKTPLLVRAGSKTSVASSSDQPKLVRLAHAVRRYAFKYVPIAEWLPQYSLREHLAKDAAGGLTLGCILVAQSMAHADLCKVALIRGPYSCILPPIIYSIFGTCVHSSVGTGGLVSLLTGEQLDKYGDVAERTQVAAVFTLLVGAIITLMGVFRLAFLVRFLSRPALSGFITASALLIIASQIKPLLGLPRSDSGGLMYILTVHPGEFQQFSGGTVVLSALSLLFLMNAKWLKSCNRVLSIVADAKELVVLSLSAMLCYRYADPLRIQVIGEVPSGLPSLTSPFNDQVDTQLLKDMLPGAFFVALVTFLSSFAGAKKFALKAGYQVVAVNELVALGLANVGGSLCGAVPTQIGLSRMGIAYSAGIKSQLGANVFVAIIVAAVLSFLSPLLHYMPRCVLNTIIVNGASHLTEFDHLRWLWSLRHTRTRQRTYLVDCAVWTVACLSTLYFGAFIGIAGAVGVSLALIIYQVADPPISTLGWVAERQRWLNVKTNQGAKCRDGVLACRLEGPLFYANVERLQEWLADVEVAADGEGRPLKALVLSADAVSFVDTTAVEALRQLVESYHARNIAFLVANASGQPSKILQHVLGTKLPAESLANAWDVQECVEYLAYILAQNASIGGSSSAHCSPNLNPCTPPQDALLIEPLMPRMPGLQSAPDLQRFMSSSSADSHATSSSHCGVQFVRPLKRGAAWATSQGDLAALDSAARERGDSWSA